MNNQAKSIVKILITVAALAAAGFIAYKIYQYVMMYVVGKAVVGASREAMSGMSKFD